MYRTERVLILAAVLVVGLGRVLALGRGALSLGTEQSAIFTWLMTASLVLIAGTGARWLRRGMVAARGNISAVPDVRAPLVPLPMDTVLPATMLVGFVLFVQVFDNGVAQALIIVLAGLSLGAIYWAQAHSFDTEDPYFGLAQSALNVLAHLTAFLFFSVIYGLKTRSIISSTAVGIVAALLIYEMLTRDAAWHQALDLPTAGRRRTLVLLSVVSGLVLAEITSGLSYWAALTMLVGGAMLLVLFYVLQGLVGHYVDRTLTRQVLVEFAVVGTLGTVVVFASAFFT